MEHHSFPQHSDPSCSKVTGRLSEAGRWNNPSDEVYKD